MNKWIKSFSKTLEGKPDEFLTYALVTTGIALIAIGMFAPVSIKPLVLAYEWLP